MGPIFLDHETNAQTDDKGISIRLRLLYVYFICRLFFIHKYDLVASFDRLQNNSIDHITASEIKPIYEAL